MFSKQLAYVGYALLSRDPADMDVILDTSVSFILFHCLHIVSLGLFVLSRFAAAEVALVMNFANMSALYFRHSRNPGGLRRHMISGPLTWTFFALYWNGSCIVPEADAARLIGQVFIWGLLGYGLFFAFTFHVSRLSPSPLFSLITMTQDLTVCLSLGILATSVAVYHARAHSGLELCIPPFIIAGGLVYASAALSLSGGISQPASRSKGERDRDWSVDRLVPGASGKESGGLTALEA